MYWVLIGTCSALNLTSLFTHQNNESDYFDCKIKLYILFNRVTPLAKNIQIFITS